MASLDEIEDLVQNPRTTLDEIELLINAREAELSETPSTAFGEAVGSSFINNLLALPGFAGQVLAQGAAGTEAALEGGASVLTGGEFDFERRANRNLEFPGFAQLNTIPKPTTQDIEALFSAAGKELKVPQTPEFVEGRPTAESLENLLSRRVGRAFPEELARINAAEAQTRQQFPKASFAGDVGGDVATLLTGRLPLAKGINTAESALMARKFTESMTVPSVRKLVETVLDSKVIRNLAKGTGRALETGTEAAVLSLLKDGDPLETAAFAAGGQLAGSGLLEFSKGLLTGGPLKIGLKLALASASFGTLIQMTKETIPGGDPSALAELADSASQGFEKVQLSLVLGLVSTLAGAGRLRGGDLANNLPKIADALATIPRATSISLLEDYLNASPDEQQTIDATLNQLQQDPEFFGPEITDKLLKAMQDGNLTKILREEL